MAIKTVLEYVQKALSAMDSDNVDSISDTVEATQVADLLEDLYDELIQREDWPFLAGPVKLIAAGNPDNPTQFTMPESLRRMTDLWYNVDVAGGLDNKRIEWLEPEEFLQMYGQGSLATDSNRIMVSVGDQLKFWVRNDTWPAHYTSFDDTTVYLSSYKADVETTLVSEKVSALGLTNPAFEVNDTFIPLLPQRFVPLLQHTLNAAAMLLFKQQASPVDEKRVNRQLAHMRREKNRNTIQHRQANKFGRVAAGTTRVNGR